MCVCTQSSVSFHFTCIFEETFYSKKTKKKLKVVINIFNYDDLFLLYSRTQEGIKSYAFLVLGSFAGAIFCISV